MRTRRIRKREYREAFEPEDEVDFHSFRPGVTRGEIEEFTRDVIGDLKARRLSRVRFIIGKGLHSAQGPVVPPIVLELLELLREDGQIRSFSFERLSNGTENRGALIVTL
jgi:DNA-nicking Smr family endonuclease